MDRRSNKTLSDAMQAPGPQPVPFARIVCGVEGDSASAEAARQAIALAQGADLRFVAVAATKRLPRRSREELLQSLDESAQLAQAAGVEASTELIKSPHAIEALLSEANERDLLIIGHHGRSRPVGVAIDSTAARAVHESERPLLIAREPRGAAGFPRHITLASDGGRESWDAARVTEELAAAFDSKVEILRIVNGIHPEGHRAVEAQVAEIAARTGRQPVLNEAPGHPAQAMIEAARRTLPSLVVCGRRQLHGVRAIWSVSEKISHRMPCSVLIVPGGQSRSEPSETRAG